MPVQTVHMDDIDATLLQSFFDGDPVLRLRPAPDPIVQIAVPFRGRDQFAGRGGTFTGDHNRAMAGARERCVKLRENLFGTAGRIRTNRRQWVCNAKYREWHASGRSG